jgi:hypothetical protein
MVAASCASKPTAHAPSPATSSTSPPPPPLVDAGESIASAEDAGVASDRDASDENVAIDSDLPALNDPRDDHARRCTWPSATISSQTCALVFATEERTDIAPHEKVRLAGILVVRGKLAALTEFESPPMGVSFDVPPNCEGDAPVAIEGNLEPTGEALWSSMIIGPEKSPYRLVHAKVLGSAKAVCKPVDGLPTALPFDRLALGAALAAVKLNDCNPHTHEEPGHVQITFGSNGRVTKVELDDTLSGGDAVAQCVRAHFAKVRIPPFHGREARVGKSFVLS